MADASECVLWFKAFWVIPTLFAGADIRSQVHLTFSFIDEKMKLGLSPLSRPAQLENLGAKKQRWEPTMFMLKSSVYFTGVSWRSDFNKLMIGGCHEITHFLIIKHFQKCFRWAPLMPCARSRASNQILVSERRQDMTGLAKVRHDQSWELCAVKTGFPFHKLKVLFLFESGLFRVLWRIKGSRENKLGMPCLLLKHSKTFQTRSLIISVLWAENCWNGHVSHWQLFSIPEVCTLDVKTVAWHQP